MAEQKREQPKEGGSYRRVNGKLELVEQTKASEPVKPPAPKPAASPAPPPGGKE